MTVRPPWFRRWPSLAVALAGVLFAGVLVLRIVQPAEVPVDLLYCLPVALLAVAFGRLAGLLAGLLAVTASTAWLLLADADRSWLGSVSRTVPLLLLGGLLGDAMDRLVRSQVQAQQASAAVDRTRAAVELNDTVVQGLAAAKWALESGRSDRALEIVQETLGHSQQMVSQLLRDEGMGPSAGAGPPPVVVAR